MKTLSAWLHRLLGRQKPRIPDPLWQACLRRLPFLHRLTAAEQGRLKQLCERFLDKKPVIGAAGMEITDDIAVVIAAQACLPVLNLSLELYDDMSAVVVYPTGFIVTRKETDAAGVVHEWREVLSGEAMDQGGTVALSWEDASGHHGHADGFNVVIHEFAHKIDMANGGANGRPPFLAAFHQELQAREWQSVFGQAYDDFCRCVDEAMHPSFYRPRAIDPLYPHIQEGTPEYSQPEPLPFNAYAATNPAEFFAVVSEAFFQTPRQVQRYYPDMYALLVRYYRQNPLQP